MFWAIGRMMEVAGADDVPLPDPLNGCVTPRTDGQDRWASPTRLIPTPSHHGQTPSSWLQEIFLMARKGSSTPTASFSTV